MKIDRLLAITLHLMNRKQATAKELAELFEVSVRTIQRDMEALALAGIPIFTERGREGGYRIIEEYTIDRQLFQPQELRGLGSVFGEISNLLGSRRLAATHDKIRLLSAKATSSDHEPLIMDLAPWGFNDRIRSHFQTVYQAVIECRRLSIRYVSAEGECTERHIDPLSVIVKGNSWYVYAHCLLRRSSRLFKLTRLQASILTSQTFKPEQYPPYDRQKGMTDNRKPVMFILRFRSESTEKIRDLTGSDNLLKMPDGSVIGLFPFPEDEWVYSWILSLGPSVELLEPRHARELVKKRAGELAAVYGCGGHQPVQKDTSC